MLTPPRPGLACRAGGMYTITLHLGNFQPAKVGIFQPALGNFQPALTILFFGHYYAP